MLFSLVAIGRARSSGLPARLLATGLGGLALFNAAGASANDLYFGMPVNYDQGEVDTLFVYGTAGVGGTVTSPGGFSSAFTVGGNGVTSVTIPNSYDLTASGLVTNFGFHVATNDASQNVGASYLSREAYTTDTTYLLNSTALGTSYYAVGSSRLGSYPSQLSIVGTQANTTVTITPSVALDGGYSAGAPFTVTLGAGQAVMYTGQDVSGTKVVSSAPIAVFGGGQCSQVPLGQSACDHTITALPSTDHYTTEAVIPTTTGVETPSSNILRVLAATNSTVVTYQGAMLTTLNAGEYYDVRTGAGGVLTSNNPVLLNEFLTGQVEHSNTPGDPAISFIPGTNQWLSEYLLSTPVGSQAYTANFLDLAILSSDLTSLMLNGATVSGTNCTTLVGTSYSTCNIAISAGVYDIKADHPFLALVDGGTQYDSYLTFVGTTFSAGASPIATINTTGGDVQNMPGVFTLGSAAANAATIVFDGGTLQMSGGSFAGNIVPAPVTINATNGTIDTSTGNGGFSGTVSGPGSLTIKGGGTFTLTGDNTYAGGTVVNSSTVAVGRSTALGTGVLTLNNGTLQGLEGLTIANAAVISGTATIQTSDSGRATPPYSGGINYTGQISGSGTLVKTGATGLRLSAANTYTGGTIIEQGHIGVTNDNSLGTGSVTFAGGFLVAHNDGVTISNSAVLSADATIDPQGFTLTYAGAVTGSGSLTKESAGTLVLSGANSFTGALMVNAGTLQAGSATGLSPSSAVTVASGATLDIAGFSSTTASLAGSGTVTNSGTTLANLTSGGNGSSTTFTGTVQDGTAALSLTKTGSGALLLSGANSYSGGTFLDMGEIVVGSSTALGSGLISMAEGTTLGFAGSLTLDNAIAFTVAADPTIDTGSNNVTLSGPISGPGSLSKIGSGTLDLTGTNPYTGDTTVAEGGLLVDGSVANSSVTVNGGAALGGRGTIGSLNLLPGAVLSPGAGTPFSTLTILGDATLQSGSTYLVNLNAAGQSDRVVVGGSAALNGATLAVNGVGSGFGPNSRFDILSAAGGIVGQFGSVVGSSNLAFLAPALSYTGTDVTLGFTQRAAFASVATTPNQRGVARAIESLGPGNPLYDAVVIQDAAGARRAFQTASGETRASATTAAVTSTRVVNSIIFDRLWNLPLPQAGDALDALKQFEPHNLPALLQCYTPTTALSTGLRQGAGYTVWGQAIGDFGQSGSDGNAAAVDRTLGGFVLGIDSRIDAKAFDNWRVGVAGGYTNTQFSVKSGGGSGTFENVFGTLYAGARYGAVTLRFGGTYGGTATNASRTVVFPGFFESERSSSGGETGQVFGEIGYRFTTSTAVIEPTFNGAITHTHQDSYREKGGAAALVGAAQDVDVGSTVLGVRGEVLPFGTLPIVARLFLGWQHTYGDINPAATLAFAAGGAAFSSYGAPIDRNAVVGEVGLDWRATTALSLGLTYSGQAGERNTDNAVKGRVEYRF